jgi:TolB-like protein/Flp pilus assembly protein TadD
MENPISPSAPVRFGLFELDLRAGELRKQGAKVKLQEQPLQILAMLLEHPGRVVTREELRARLWPADTFVDFDHGLNKAMNKLREALGDSAENPRFIETLARRGYRFISSLATGSGRIESLAVLPFKNLSCDPEQEYFAEGVTEALINNLAKIGALRVISRTTAMRYKQTEKSLPQIARELNVDAVVEGTVQRSAERVCISAQLIQATTDTHLWAESYERDLRDILALQAEVADAIVKEIQVKVTPEEQAQLGRTRRVTAEAYEAYLKGRFYWNKRNLEGLTKGAEYFQKAIDNDPTYAAAYAGLADSGSRLGFWADVVPAEGCARGKAAALKAIEMDNTLAEAYAALCYASLHYDFNVRTAEEAAQRAMELDRKNGFAVQGRVCCLMVRGRAEEAAAEGMRAVELEPLSLALQWTAGVAIYFARKYDEAIALSQKMLELDSLFAPSRYLLGLAFVQKRMHEQAVGEMEAAVRISQRQPFYLGFLGCVYGAVGRKEAAFKIIEELKETSKQRHVSPFWSGLIYSSLCENDEAFFWLERALEERAPWMVYLKAPPWFDNLRSDARYYRLLQRMNIPI